MRLPVTNEKLQIRVLIFNNVKIRVNFYQKATPCALYLGIADGAKNNWSFLEQHTSRQLLDFFHVTEYLANVYYAAYSGKTDKPKRTIWLDKRCQQLKRLKSLLGTVVW